MPAGRVPDLRGMFLRGHGSQVFNSGGYGNVIHTSGQLGQTQGDASRRIQGYVARVWIQGGGYEDGGAITHSWVDEHFYGHGPGGVGRTAIRFDSSRVVPTAPENRPVNVAVRYLIRAAN